MKQIQQFVSRSTRISFCLLLALSSAIAGLSAAPASAATAEKITYHDNNGNTVSINPDGTGYSVLHQGDGIVRVSPDGTKILFARGVPDLQTLTSNPDIFVANLDGTGETDLTPNTPLSPDDGPAWSPDGQHIAFSAIRDDSTGNYVSGIYIMDADGSNLHFVAPRAVLPSWSPDGSKLVFRYMPTSNSSDEIGVVNADGSGLTRLTDNSNADGSPVWSPDGTRIAWVANCNCGNGNGSGNTISTMHPDGTDRVDLASSPNGGDVMTPAWSPDSSQIVFSKYVVGQGTYFLYSVSSTGGPDQLLYTDHNGAFYPSWGLLSVPDSGPTNLSAPSPTLTPSLTWDAVTGADSYNVYRNGVKVDTSTTNAYTDPSAPSGSSDYYVTAVVGGAETAHSNTITVVVGSAPAITSAASTSVSLRQPFNFTVTSSGNPTSSLSQTGTLPTGVTFTDNGDGTATLSGTAAAGTAGTYPLSFTASNGLGSPAAQSFTLTVTAATSAPAIVSPSSDTETFGVPFSFTVNTTGYPAPTLKKTGALPAGVTFADNGDGTATLAGTPTAAAIGSYNFTFTAKSSAGTATQSFVLTITKAPVLKNIPTTVTMHAGTANAFAVSAKGNPTPTLSESGNLPAGLSFTDNGDGTATLAGTPAAGSGGAYAITISAANSLGTTSDSFTLKITEGPVFTSTSTASATVGSAFSFQVTASGYPAPTLSKTGSLPRGLSWKASTGTISGTPAAGTAGTYPLSFTAKNSSGTVTQNFVLTVQ